MSDQSPDVKALTPVETQHISAACRANWTHDSAWAIAVDLLRRVYDAQVQRQPGVTISLAIYVSGGETS